CGSGFATASAPWRSGRSSNREGLSSMKLPALIALTTLFLMPQTEAPSPKPPDKLASAVFDWEKLTQVPTPKGSRRDVFDGATTTVDKAHCHITTLNAGENSGEPRRHLQEEV